MLVRKILRTILISLMFDQNYEWGNKHYFFHFIKLSNIAMILMLFLWFHGSYVMANRQQYYLYYDCLFYDKADMLFVLMTIRIISSIR